MPAVVNHEDGVGCHYKGKEEDEAMEWGEVMDAQYPLCDYLSHRK